MLSQEIPDHASSSLARRALFVTLSLALAGASLGLVAARLGTVVGYEIGLVLCSVLFSSGALGTLIVFRKVDLQTVATASIFFLPLTST
jgi:hypothetical protein